MIRMEKNELTFQEFKKGLKLTEEEKEEIKLEMEIIEATIEARKKSNLTQRELSKKTGIKQPAIARIERRACSPQTNTLIKLLYPIGYTIKVVPLDKKQ